MSIEPRHEFYETDQTLTISIFDKGANPDEVAVKFTPQTLNYQNGEKLLVLEPLTGEIEPEACNFTVSKVKVEVRLAKKSPGRWVRLVRDSASNDSKVCLSGAAPGSNTTSTRIPHKNWEKVSDNILKSEKDKSMVEDPNAVDPNNAFAELFSGIDDDARRAVMKSYIESGGTTLSTDWDDVSKGPVSVKPPEGQEWRKWG